MKKVVRLTERDLTRIVKRVINEGGYQGIKNELDHTQGLIEIASGFLMLKRNLEHSLHKMLSIITNNPYGVVTADYDRLMTKKVTNLVKTFQRLKKLISIYEQKEMTLSKSDLEDYGVDINTLLSDLEKSYEEISHVRDITDDENTISNMNRYEKLIDDIVEKLDSIED